MTSSAEDCPAANRTRIVSSGILRKSDPARAVPPTTFTGRTSARLVSPVRNTLTVAEGILPLTTRVSAEGVAVSLAPSPGPVKARGMGTGFCRYCWAFDAQKEPSSAGPT